MPSAKTISNSFARCTSIAFHLFLFFKRLSKSGCLKPKSFRCVAPHAGRDRRIPGKMSHLRFQSTHPSRGATRSIYTYCLVFTIFQSTRPVRGATQQQGLTSDAGTISIRAPRAGRDAVRMTAFPDTADFNPRAPCGARPAETLAISDFIPISIRAPRAGRDPTICISWTAIIYFNPRAPCGARLPPGDRSASGVRDFNPRAPCGARPARNQVGLLTCTFQSARPVRGATAKVYKITLHTFATKGNS